MTTTAPQYQRGIHTPWWLHTLVGWQALFAATALGLAIGMGVGWGWVVEGSLRPVLVVLLFLAALGAALSVWWLPFRRHQGRLLALLTNGLLATLSLFIALQEVDLFNGLDAVGANFGRGMPFLALMAVGWLVSGWSDRFPSLRTALRLASRSMMALGGLFLLLVVGLIPGLWEFLNRIVGFPAIGWIGLALAAGGFTWLLWREEANQLFDSTNSQLETMSGLVFVAPNILGFLAFLAGPLVFSLLVSFTDWDGLGEATWIGVSNYTELITDSFFLKSIRNILVFGAVAVPLAIGPALVLAALMNTKLPGMKVFRAIYFLPAVAGVVGVTLIWKQLYNASVGFINYGLVRLYDLINLLPGLDLTAPQPQWLSSSSTALFSVMLVFAFQTTGFNTVLFLAGMQGVPGSLYEAAELDGAGPWAKFRRITVPMLRPTTVFVVITTTILALQLFSEPFILNAPNSPNGPSNATLTPVIYLYQNAFERFNQGYASAIGWVLFLLIFVITLIYFRSQKDEGVLS